MQHRYYNPDFYCLANETIFDTRENDQKVQQTDYVYVVIAVTIIVVFFLAKFYKKLCGFEEFKNEPDGQMETLPESNVEVDKKVCYTTKKSRSISCFGMFSMKDDEIDLEKNTRKENKMSIEQESHREYNYGGYIPLSFGIIIDNYAVIRKLGYGHFSTVWLCQQINMKSYVAIKIAKGSSTFRTVAKDEINILECTRMKNPKHKGYKHVIQLLRHFQVQSINGRHTCLAFDVMGPSLLFLIEQSNLIGIQLAGVRNIIKQVLLGLTYLHDECNIIHTDIKPENILIKVTHDYVQNMVDLTKKYILRNIRMPKSYVSTISWFDADDEMANNENILDEDIIEINRNETYPSDCSMKKLITKGKLYTLNEIKEPIWIDQNIWVQIVDLGNACFYNLHCSDIIQTKQYRAPEVIMKAGYSYPADVWSVGCLAFEIATGEYLFNPKKKQNCTEAEEHLAMIWEAIGHIPHHITQKGEECTRYFDKNGKFRNIREEDLVIWKIKDVLIDKYMWKPDKAIPFAEFIEKMLNPDPMMRITAENALKTPWILSKHL